MHSGHPADNSGDSLGQVVPSGGRALPASFDPYGPLAGYRGPTAEPVESFGAKVLEYWRILNKHKWLIIGVTLAFVALSAVRTLMQTPLYSATVRLQIDRNVTQIMTNVAPVEADGWDYDFMRTQLEILQGRTMAERVASALQLGRDDRFFEPRHFSLLGWISGLFSPGASKEPVDEATRQGDEAARQSAAAGVVLGNRSVSPVTGSRLVNVTYTDPDPGRAQRIANGYADAFIAANLDKRFQANAAAKTFLEDKIAQLKLRLEDSEKKILEFAKKQQIIADVDNTDNSPIAQENLAAANTALGTLTAERIKNEQAWRQVESTDAINLPQLLTNDVIAKLRDQRKTLEIEYQEKLETFKPNYPAMVQISNKIKEIDQQISAEVQAIRDSLKAAYEASVALESETKRQIATLQQDVLALQERSIEYNILKREVDTNRELYTSLLQRLREVDVASGVGSNNVFVVEAAQLPGGPSSPNLFGALRKAFLLGLASAIGLALLLERLDNKIRLPEQVEAQAGLSLLGVIPQSQSLDQEIVNPRSPIAEAYRTLCTSLQFATDEGLPKTLLVTSAGPGEGKSLTALSTAKHFASLGRKVLLVDADLRNPSLHKKLNRDNDAGFTNYLTGACSPPEVMRKTDIANLAFIPSGPLPPNPADLLGSARLHSMLSIALEVFDLVVLDGPPVMGLADAQLLSNASKATLFIIGAGQSRTAYIREASRRLQLSRGLIIGAALTKYDAKAAGYGYGYGYGHGYGYGYGDAPHGLVVDHASDGRSQPQLTDAHRDA